MDANKVERSHGYSFQRRLRTQRLLAAYLIVPAQVRNHSARRTGHTDLFLVQGPRSHAEQLDLVPR